MAVGFAIFELVLINTLIGNNAEKEEDIAETERELFNTGTEAEIISYWHKLNKKDKKRIRSRVMDRVIYKEKQ